MNTPTPTPTPTPKFDNLLIQTLMSKLQVHPPPSPSTTLEDILFGTTNLDPLSLSLSDSDTDSDSPPSSKSLLAKEEAKLEKQIIRTILSSRTEDLNPNSGQAVSIGDHHICVGFHQDPDSDYRVWEWHGHIMLFHEEEGYTPEYVYGNYFERLGANNANKNKKKESENVVDEEDEEEEEEEDEKGTSLGLKDLIESEGRNCPRILHRAASPRFVILLANTEALNSTNHRKLDNLFRRNLFL